MLLEDLLLPLHVGLAHLRYVGDLDIGILDVSEIDGDEILLYLPYPQPLANLVPFLQLHHLHLVEQLDYFSLGIVYLVECLVFLIEPGDEADADLSQTDKEERHQSGLLLKFVVLFRLAIGFDGVIAFLDGLDRLLDDHDEYLEDIIVEVALFPFGDGDCT